MPAPTDAKRGRTVDSLFCGKATAGQTVHRTVCLDRPFESTRPNPNKNIGPAKRLEGYFGGGGWIRTTVGIASRFTVCPLWPLGNTPICT